MPFHGRSCTVVTHVNLDVNAKTKSGCTVLHYLMRLSDEMLEDTYCNGHHRALIEKVFQRAIFAVFRNVPTTDATCTRAALFPFWAPWRKKGTTQQLRSWYMADFLERSNAAPDYADLETSERSPKGFEGCQICLNSSVVRCNECALVEHILAQEHAIDEQIIGSVHGKARQLTHKAFAGCTRK